MRSFKAGQYLFKEGQTSRSMFLIKKGAVAVRKMKGSSYVEIARIYHNQVLGELSFFDRKDRSAAAVAISDVEVMEIEYESLEKIWNGVPDYLRAIMQSVAERLRKANESLRKLQKAVETDEVPESTEAEFDPDSVKGLEGAATESSEAGQSGGTDEKT